MNIELIVGEIDAEIEKLQRIRAILKKLSSPQPRKAGGWQPARVKRLRPIAPQPAPRLIVLAPKQRREYTRRAKPLVLEPKALAAPASNRPVFVPKTAVRESPAAKAAGAESSLEAVMRRRLLGGVAQFFTAVSKRRT